MALVVASTEVDSGESAEGQMGCRGCIDVFGRVGLEKCKVACYGGLDEW